MIELTPYEAYIKFLSLNKPKEHEISQLEEIISKSSCYSRLYAKFILKGAFPKGHYAIFTDNQHRDKKYLDFLRGINYDMKEVGEWLI